MTVSIQDYLRPGRRAHLVGIAGVSMAPLAEVLSGAGATITGSDLRESAVVHHLRSLGIEVTIGHLAERVQGADCVIRTAAVHDDNPEIRAAHDLGIPVFERTQAWGAIMRQYQHALCVSGTHGKTTTTSMCAHIFLAAQRDPTVMVGGTLPVIGAGHRVGRGDTIIFESCEYYNSFLALFPTVAVILNVDADHLDFFKDLADVERSFRTFAQLVPQDGGIVVANGEDENTMDVIRGIDRPVVTFGLETGDVHTQGLVWERGYPHFNLVWRGTVVAPVFLSVPGVHNVKNALAAAAAALSMGVPAQDIAQGLNAFQGVGRRFERKGSFLGAEVYDDYAHHPQELHALLEMAQSLPYKRVICAFQPHTYTRTQELFDDFLRELRQCNQLVLAEIYAAREVNETGISSQDLARELPGSIYCATMEEVTQTLARMAQPGDLIVTVGAGDIYLAGEALLDC